LRKLIRSLAASGSVAGSEDNGQRNFPSQDTTGGPLGRDPLRQTFSRP
jgi:hypothetical protein